MIKAALKEDHEAVNGREINMYVCDSDLVSDSGPGLGRTDLSVDVEKGEVCALRMLFNKTLLSTELRYLNATIIVIHVSLSSIDKTLHFQVSCTVCVCVSLGSRLLTFRHL